MRHCLVLNQTIGPSRVWDRKFPLPYLGKDWNNYLNHPITLELIMQTGPDVIAYGTQSTGKVFSEVGQDFLGNPVTFLLIPPTLWLGFKYTCITAGWLSRNLVCTSSSPLPPHKAVQIVHYTRVPHLRGHHSCRKEEKCWQKIISGGKGTFFFSVQRCQMGCSGPIQC